jgi:hypothetical protein
MFDCLSDELETIGMRDKKLVEIRNRKIEHVYLRKIVFLIGFSLRPLFCEIDLLGVFYL